MYNERSISYIVKARELAWKAKETGVGEIPFVINSLVLAAMNVMHVYQQFDRGGKIESPVFKTVSEGLVFAKKALSETAVIMNALSDGVEENDPAKYILEEISVTINSLVKLY